MKSIHYSTILALSLLWLPVSRLQAQSNLAVSVQLTVRTQDAGKLSGFVQTDRTRATRVTTKDILKWLGTALAKNFTGATLVRASANSTNYLVLKGSNVLADVSRFFSDNRSGLVYDETTYSRTRQDTFTGWRARTSTFDDGAGNKFSLTGLLTETYSAPAVDKQGNQRISETLTLNGAGAGELGGQFAIFSGTITASGKMTQNTPTQGVTNYFLVAELPGHVVHHDSFVIPLTGSQLVAHARDLIARGPGAGGKIVFAEIVAGADGVNRDLRSADQRPWSWHVTQVTGFGDVGAELYDGWPGEVENDVAGWIQNTGGKIGFWTYTVVAELPPARHIDDLRGH